jgi:PncC family amidohydrolase
MQNLLVNLKKITSNKSSKISKILLRNALQIATAESCTGGLLSSRLTDMAGSSAYVKANFVTYSNEAKQRFLNVSEETLKKHGAVSKECALEMAEGLIKLTNSDVVLCTTGVAGPSTSENKPVGLIYIACGLNGNISVNEFKLNPKYNRKNMKFMFTETALDFAIETLNN